MKFWKEWFSYEGRLMQFLHKTGELILINIACLLCCLPVITIGSALTSMYYAVIKSVRRERGNPLREFFASMKRTLPKGCLVTLGAAVWFWAIQVWYESAGTAGNRQMLAFWALIRLLSLCVLVYIFPVLSRFEIKLTAVLKLSFVMSVRFLPVTAVAVLGTALAAGAVFAALPVPLILFVPGCWVYVLTFFMERALLAYMPEPEPGEDAWYYDNRAEHKKERKKEDEYETK